MTRPKKMGTITLERGRREVSRRKCWTRGETEGNLLDVALDEHQAETEDGDTLENDA
jgi:hypothetical protein